MTCTHQDAWLKCGLFWITVVIPAWSRAGADVDRMVVVASRTHERKRLATIRTLGASEDF